MARTRLPLFMLLLGAIGFLVARHLDRPLYAQQQIRTNPRLTIMPVGVLDGSKGGVGAAFVKDTKTGQCWLWVYEPEHGSALTLARDSACN
jgi:hypothetical protein